MNTNTTSQSISPLAIAVEAFELAGLDCRTHEFGFVEAVTEVGIVRVVVNDTDFRVLSLTPNACIKGAATLSGEFASVQVLASIIAGVAA